MNEIIVRTDDFQLAFRLIKELRKRNASFRLYDSREELPSGKIVWLATEEEVVKEFTKNGDVRGIACTVDDIDVAVDSALHRSRGIDMISELTFGIDPGPRPGIAWLADSRLVGMSQLEQPNQVINHVLGIVSRLPHKSMTVRVGNGSPAIRDRLLNDCLAQNFVCEEVNESKTSRGFSRHEHSRSAVKIAMNPGVRIYEFREVKVSDGEIKYLKEQSRRYSNGRITISSELAQSVAIGSISLEEAIKTQLSSENNIA